MRVLVIKSTGTSYGVYFEDGTTADCHVKGNFRIFVDIFYVADLSQTIDVKGDGGIHVDINGLVFFVANAKEANDSQTNEEEAGGDWRKSFCNPSKRGRGRFHLFARKLLFGGA
jgi:hypothetical protein